MLSEPEYLVCGYEVAPTTGQCHCQGYIRFSNAKSFDACKAALYPGSHIERRRGTHEQAADYCKKEHYYYEHGQAPSQGRRTDLDRLREAILAGKSLADYIMTPGASLQAAKAWYYVNDALNPLTADMRVEEKEVHWYYGSSGSGKTYWARTNHPTAWVSPADNAFRWYTYYHGQDNVIFEEMIPETYRKHVELFHRLLHEWSECVEVKGASTIWRPKKIIICSILSPQQFADQVYATPDVARQLLRRITHVRRFEASTGPLGTTYTNVAEGRP